MRHSIPFLLFAALAAPPCAPASAAPPPVRPQPPPMGAEEMAGHMPPGAALETRLDADVTGDGVVDTVFIAANDEVRVLKVLAGFHGEFDLGYEPLASGEMEVAPLGAASLSVKKGVLLVEDLAGGTTAIQSLYRYRYDPRAKRMRLIGDDVTLYSRTNAHGSTKISTNRLTGAQTEVRSEIVGEAYIDQPAKRRTLPTAPVYMEQAPTPAQTLDFGN